MNKEQKNLLSQLKRPFMGTGIRIHYEVIDGMKCFVWTNKTTQTAIEIPTANYNEYFEHVVKGVKIAFARANNG